MSKTSVSVNRRPWGGWGNWFSNLVTALTLIGVAGTVIVLVSSLGVRGCGGGMAGLIILFYAFILLVIGVIGAIASTGVIFMYRRSRWGPLLLVPANLLTIGFLGWSQPVSAGQLAWAIVLVSLVAAPTAAVVLVLLPLLSRDRLWVRLVEVVVLGALAWPLVSLSASGLRADISMAQLPAPPASAAPRGAC